MVLEEGPPILRVRAGDTFMINVGNLRVLVSSCMNEREIVP